MPKDDDILLGGAAKLTDSDGDGVSDAQEQLDGTDPGDAADNIRRADLKPDLDVRGDLDRVTLEREVAFDPAANMPEGMSVDSGLKGLTNVDGSPLSSGADHFGIGEDSLLTGRLGANSPLDMLRDPAGGGGDGPKGQPPAGADLGSRGPNWDLVGGEADTKPDEFELPGAIKPVDTPPPPMADPPAPPPDAEREPPPPPKPDGEDPDPDPEPGPVPLRTDPDAGGDSGVGGAGGTPLVIIDGPRFVEGAGGTPKIEGDTPPIKYRDLVTDGGDGSVDTSTTTGHDSRRPGRPGDQNDQPRSRDQPTTQGRSAAQRWRQCGRTTRCSRGRGHGGQPIRVGVRRRPQRRSRFRSGAAAGPVSVAAAG